MVTPGASTEPPSPVALRARGLGDGRVVADIDADFEARVGRDVHWRNVAVEVALTDTGEGDAWAATGGHRVWRTPARERYDLTFFPGTLGGFAARVAADHHPIIAGRRIPTGVLSGAIMVGVALLVLLLVAPVTGVVVVWERKIAGRMQSRFGPNRVGPRGWLQWLADGIKLILKEDLVPTDADSVLFRLSPYLMWMGVFATLVVLPLSEAAIVADLNIGLLYLSSVTTLTVIGIIMGGWASNSKWSLLGGMRSAAQIVSYELPASVALLSVVVLAGTLSPQAIIRAQGGLPTDWFIFRTPFTFVAFFIYFISALAEGNRTPFDLPEAESGAGRRLPHGVFRFPLVDLFAGRVDEYLRHRCDQRDGVLRWLERPVRAGGRRGGVDDMASGFARRHGAQGRRLVVRDHLDSMVAAAIPHRSADGPLLEVVAPGIVRGICRGRGVGVGDRGGAQVGYGDAVGHVPRLRSWIGWGIRRPHRRSISAHAVASCWRHPVHVAVRRAASGEAMKSNGDAHPDAHPVVYAPRPPAVRHPPRGPIGRVLRSAQSVMDGMAVTLSYFFRPPTTIQYPDRIPRPIVDTLPERYRGFLEVDLATCTGCKACERDCPIDCIAIDLEKVGDVRAMTRFDIDMGKCMYCNICVESCPVPNQAPGDAEVTKCIRMTREFEASTDDFSTLTFRFIRPGDAVVPFKPKKGVVEPTGERGQIARDVRKRAKEYNALSARWAETRLQDDSPEAVNAPEIVAAREAELGPLVMSAGHDERALEDLLFAQALAQTDCGACGYDDCRGYARAVIRGDEIDLAKCEPGGPVPPATWSSSPNCGARGSCETRLLHRHFGRCYAASGGVDASPACTNSPSVSTASTSSRAPAGPTSWVNRRDFSAGPVGATNRAAVPPHKVIVPSASLRIRRRSALSSSGARP